MGPGEEQGLSSVEAFHRKTLSFSEINKVRTLYFAIDPLLWWKLNKSCEFLYVWSVHRSGALRVLRRGVLGLYIKWIYSEVDNGEFHIIFPTANNAETRNWELHLPETEHFSKHFNGGTTSEHYRLTSINIFNIWFNIT